MRPKTNQFSISGRLRKTRVFLLFAALLWSCKGNAQVPDTVYPVPTPQQVAWYELEFYLFMHFGPNTFTGMEWGKGNEDPDVFNPTDYNPQQWVSIAKQAGAKGIIITAKHHDGFCLFPSAYSTHTVRESRWKGGKGDVLKDLSEALRKEGLLFGVYISPWDRNHPQYGTDEYNNVYLATMEEVITQYGPVFEMWWDGANGEGPNGKRQAYDFRAFENAMRRLSPNTVIFSDIGPDIRWIGNEKGIAGETNWAMLDTAGFQRGEGSPPMDTLNMGNWNGKHFIPGEADVSIRPGWFYHPDEDDKVKSGNELFDLYLTSVGRNANFLLNVPPDRRGLIHPNDSASLMAFKRIKEEYFKTNLVKNAFLKAGSAVPKYPVGHLKDENRKTFWMPAEGEHSVVIEFPVLTDIKAVMLQEYIELGQRIAAFNIHVSENGKDFRLLQEGTTVGYKRILTFDPVKVKSVKITITESKSIPLISEIGVY